MSPQHQRAQQRGRWLILCAGVFPLLLVLLFTFVESRQIVKRDLQSTANLALDQAESITTRAWSLLEALQPLQGKLCEDIRDDLQRLSAQFAYFRAIGLTYDKSIYCSSLFAHNALEISDVIMMPLPEKLPPAWSLSVDQIKDADISPTLIFIRTPDDGWGAFGLVDAQYLVTLMNAVNKLRGFQLNIRVGDGDLIHPSITAAPNQPEWLSGAEYHITSERFPIAVSITAPAAEMGKAWQFAFLTLLPLALVLSALFILAALYWQKRKLSFQDELRRGITNNEFSVYYQPVYGTEAQRCTGAEALLRWRRADGQWIRPDVFIAAAEAENMIIPLTRHLLKLVEEDVTRWHIEPNFHLGLNVAAEHLQDSEFIADIRQFAANVAAHRFLITLELTERSLISEGPEVVQRLQQLRQEGIHVAIDDFGTGHCSLSYLQSFPLDYLKIDQGFVRTISSQEEETPILDTIISLAHRLNLKIVAEGVETARQLHYLTQHGVGYIQGFLYAKPMDNENFTVWQHYHAKRKLTSGEEHALTDSLEGKETPKSTSA
ncbi:EAL domain-containing protein [Candidatus Symbiopectobacterium sp. NZEC127]|uniref:EAL domain-containing protein n=2 Tax=unclassified Symbiopectobacterium TaxID=2794573 RepID=UPI002226196B|nr:EAL domain-containing protein [Candidatus Symbiopectobacterium sp. NZEC127]